MILTVRLTLSHQPSSNIVSFTLFEAVGAIFLQKDQRSEIIMVPRVALTSLNLLGITNEEANRVSAIFNNDRSVYCLYIVRALVWFYTKFWIWRASSIRLPIHVTFEAIDLSAKFKE